MSLIIFLSISRHLGRPKEDSDELLLDSTSLLCQLRAQSFMSLTTLALACRIGCAHAAREDYY